MIVNTPDGQVSFPDSMSQDDIQGVLRKKYGAPSASSSSSAPAATPAQGDLGTTALWNKPANVSWGDYFMAHLTKPFEGANQAAQDYARVAGDAATFGLGDRLQAALTGNSVEQERANTNAAYGRLGAMAPIVSTAMYAMGPGELGIAKGLGEAVAPALGGGKLARWTAGVLGSGVEGAGAGMVGAAGHDENPNTGMLLGGAAGLAGGVPGGVVGRGGTLPPAATAADLRAQAKTAYAPLSNIVYNSASEVHPALDEITARNALRDWSGYKWGDAPKTQAEVNTLLKRPQLSANDLQQAQKALGKVQGNLSASDNDKMYASYFDKQLQGVLENGLPFSGVPQNLPPGVQPSNYAASVKAAGDLLHGRAKDAQRLDDIITKSQVAGGPSINSQATSFLTSPKGQQYAPPGSPLYDAMNALAATKAPTASAAPSAFDARHALHPLVSGLIGGAATGLGGQVAEGHFDPLHLAAETIAGGVLGYGFHRAVPAAIAPFQRAAQQRALDAARVVASTGQRQAPVLPPAPLRDLIRQAIYGRGAVGGY